MDQTAGTTAVGRGFRSADEYCRRSRRCGTKKSGPQAALDDAPGVSRRIPRHHLQVRNFLEACYREGATIFEAPQSHATLGVQQILRFFLSS